MLVSSRGAGVQNRGLLLDESPSRRLLSPAGILRQAGTAARRDAKMYISENEPVGSRLSALFC
ncbi:hypothetical protein EYF80_052701 [Liparis tanakae]|uniref:Uncharacterized protein n=1 Tax=Liparis tanakae TaxID=230148 RepID=A0A4Z2F7F9_9TELE|nr:hypothetical protein EYF80_052701 [Liparis tanakae]